MKMSGGVLSCCVALLLTLTSVSAVEKLKSISDLKKINFGSSVPKHSLLLLYWFANTIDLDTNNVMRLTFDPDREEYGSHYYGNYEGMLDPLPEGYRYYTVGNLNEDTGEELPSYVRNPPREYVGRNMDRIIFRVQEQKARRTALQRIDQVYITQHYEYLGTYNPIYTYRITANLLRQIREFSVQGNQLLHLRNQFGSNANDSDLRQIRQIWGNLACLGLLLFIVIQERYQTNIRVESIVGPEITTRVQRNIGPEITTRVQSNIGPEITTRVQSNIGPEITTRVGSNIGPEITRVQSNIGPEITTRVGSNIGPEITTRVQSNIGPEITTRAGSNIGPEITRRVGSNIGPVIRGRVENNISYGGASGEVQLTSLVAPQDPSEPSEPLVDNPELFSFLFCFTLICFVFYVLTAF